MSSFCIWLFYLCLHCLLYILILYIEFSCCITNAVSLQKKWGYMTNIPRKWNILSQTGGVQYAPERAIPRDIGYIRYASFRKYPLKMSIVYKTGYFAYIWNLIFLNCYTKNIHSFNRTLFSLPEARLLHFYS